MFHNCAAAAHSCGSRQFLHRGGPQTTDHGPGWPPGS